MIPTFNVRVNPLQSRIIQELVFSLGGTWEGGEIEVINTDFPVFAL